MEATSFAGNEVHAPMLAGAPSADHVIKNLVCTEQRVRLRQCKCQRHVPLPFKPPIGRTEARPVGGGTLTNQ